MSTEEEGACVLRANRACVDQLWDTQHEYDWKYLGDHLYYVFLKNVIQSPNEGTEHVYQYEFFENCVLKGIKKETLEDLMTVRGTHRYQRGHSLELSNLKVRMEPIWK